MRLGGSVYAVGRNPDADRDPRAEIIARDGIVTALPASIPKATGGVIEAYRSSLPSESGFSGSLVFSPARPEHVHITPVYASGLIHGRMPGGGAVIVPGEKIVETLRSP